MGVGPITPESAETLAEDPAFLSRFLPWQPLTAYTAGTLVSNAGVLYTVDANFTTGATFSATGLTNYATQSATRVDPTVTGKMTLTNTEPGVEYPLNVRINTGHADGLKDRFTIENNPSQTRVDMNIRGANLNIGTTTSSDTNSGGGAIYLVRGTGDSSTPFACYKQGSDTVVGLRITPTCAIDMRNTDLASTVMTVQNSAATTKVFQLTNTGKILWGNTGDTSLERAAAGVLATGAAHCLKTGLAATGSRPSASAMGQASQFFDTTLNKPIWSDGTTWRDAAGTVV